MKTSLLVSSVVLLVGLAVGGPVRAAPQVKLKVIEAGTVDPKLAGKAPFIQATVINSPTPKAIEEVSLTQDGARPIEIKADQLKTYAEGNEPISIMLLIEGHFLYMGNETYTDVVEDQYVGIHSKLPDSINAVAKLGPPGSQAALAVYHSSAELKHPMSDIATLTPDKLGKQQDYQNNTTRNLIAGLDLSLTELKKTATPRRALIIISDGADLTGDASREVSAAKKKLLDEGVEIYVVYFAISEEQAPSNPGHLKILDDTLPSAKSMDDIVTKIESIGSAIQSQRYYVRFPGYDEKLKIGFTWDGAPHDFILKSGDKEVTAEPVSLTTLPLWALDEGGIPWWLFVLIPLLVILLVVVGIKVMGQKEVVVPQAAPPPPAPPPPVGSPKTVMLNLQGGDDGPPIVGWIVPLNGANQFQTFKLQPGVTKVGTGGAAHIVINDGFMSTEHAQFVMSPMGFTLQDGGSTNGVYVNDRRVDKHELVDNDVITMGKTNFKFKTTM
jgi:hypothetical protein